MTDDRRDSLAAQAASWVPPWERSPREPDRTFQAEATADAADPAEVDPAAADPAEADDSAGPEGDAPGEEDVEEGGVPPLETESDEHGTVDEPAGTAVPVDEPEVITGPEVEVPDAIAEAAEAPGEDEGTPVDAPLLPDGDDAGDVFDQAADDDVSDDAGVDLPVADEPDVSGDAAPAEPGAAGDAVAEGAGAVDTAAVEEPAAADDQDYPPAADGGPAAVDDAAPVDEAAAGDAVAAAIPAQAVPRKRRKKDAQPEPAPEVEEEPHVPMEDGELRAALEAILLVVDEPVAELQLAQIVEEPVERIGAVLEDISARYTAAGHGFDLRRAAGGWRLYTRPEYAAYVERFVLDGQSVRLTQAALETLAVVAYKQPVTRSRISAIRGVNCDGVMRTLATRGLIEECGTEPETGAHLYRTTTLFLEKLGLNSVDQLPPLAPFLPDDVEEVIDASG